MNININSFEFILRASEIYIIFDDHRLFNIISTEMVRYKLRFYEIKLIKLV